MITRTITGLLAASSAIALVLYGPDALQLCVLLSVAGLSAIEFDRLCFSKVCRVRQVRSLFLVFLCALTLRSAMGLAWLLFAIPLCALAFEHVRVANRSGEFEFEIRGLAMELLGVVYLVCTLGFLLPIVRFGEFGREFLLLLFFLVFAGDTFAYFVGTFFGKHRLAKNISPKKSLEGSVGAVLGSGVFAWIWFEGFYTGPKSSELVLGLWVLVPVVSILAQLGDLFESLLKRSGARKDSGQLLPGHGGFLDRIDGLTFSAPAFYFYIRYVLGSA